MRHLLGLLRALLMLPLLAAPLPAFAASANVDTAALDELFAQLHDAHSAGDANEIVQQIWSVWFNPDVPELAKRMQTVSLAASSGQLDAGIAILDGIVRDYPDYAEGWNQRATLYFMQGKLDASLADIAKVLTLEPRHFGALSGRVQIYLKQGKHDEALKDMIAALAIDPYLSGRELFPELAHPGTQV
jgi:tetratricopeptide (TPR) repeat protein